MYYYQQQPQPMNAAMVHYTQPGGQQGILKGRPVSSLEEARAAQIDFDGSLFVFPDIANKKIYTKQINLDGTATLNAYGLEQIAQPEPPQLTYVTKEEFNNIVKELELLKDSINNNDIKGVKHNEQSTTKTVNF